MFNILYKTKVIDILLVTFFIYRFMINNFKQFIKESISNNIKFNGVDFNITEGELDEILVDIMDEIENHNIIYYLTPFSSYYRTLSDNNWILSDEEQDIDPEEYFKDCFFIVFEDGDGINNRNDGNDYQMYNNDIEYIIERKREILNEKFKLYNLSIKDNNYSDNDFEYFLAISKI